MENLIRKNKLVKKWTKEESIIAMKKLFNEELKWDEDTVKRKITSKIFKEYGLGSMLRILYNQSPYNAIKEVYPNVKPWELKRVPRNYWNKETRVEALNWLFNEKLKWDEDTIKRKVTSQVFKEYGLYSMFHSSYNGTVYNAIKELYPNIKPWELKSINIPSNYWNKDNQSEKLKWLFKEELKWNEDDIREKMTIQVFKKYGLYNVILNSYGGSAYNAIKEIYLNIKPWELKLISIPNNYWNKETRVEALNWLFNEKLKWNKDDIRSKLSVKIFRENGLKTLLIFEYGGSPYKAIKELYPDIEPHELKNKPRTCWNKKVK